MHDMMRPARPSSLAQVALWTDLEILGSLPYTAQQNGQRRLEALHSVKGTV